MDATKTLFVTQLLWEGAGGLLNCALCQARGTRCFVNTMSHRSSTATFHESITDEETGRELLGVPKAHRVLSPCAGPAVLWRKLLLVDDCS
jgi:phosphoserine aminotransferase